VHQARHLGRLQYHGREGTMMTQCRRCAVAHAV
jgi:hypothetical protein